LGRNGFLSGKKKMIAPTMFSHGEREQLFKEKEIKLLKGATS
jgi:hypothetical protein